ncbi:MAG TPA: hypothetical protein DGG95_00920 [Cytophagales bacterium]|jgi:hypothetical protein|nr:hypothetical protein [Cytophagales bacterium]
MACCYQQPHDLQIVVEFDVNSMSSSVVRWCTVCGAIVIDRDYDGRTNPGQIMPMRYPGWINLIKETNKNFSA